MRYPSIETRTGTFLPEQYWLAHEFCFFLHDVMARLLQAGERSGIFKVSLALTDDERRSFEETDDILDWVMEHRSPEERSAVLVTMVFPAVLSDMLHCVYETLETSRKAKLNVSYMLLRKPIQESLYLLETAVADRVAFATKLSADPLKLWSQGAGGCEAHTPNIALVLGTIKEEQRFDAGYLAQLRYDKAASDGFDGACNRAIHLFTGHKSIKTEAMNINFIFSNAAAKRPNGLTSTAACPTSWLTRISSSSISAKAYRRRCRTIWTRSSGVSRPMRSYGTGESKSRTAIRILRLSPQEVANGCKSIAARPDFGRRMMTISNG